MTNTRMSNKPFVAYIDDYGVRCTAEEVAELEQRWISNARTCEVVIWTWNERKQAKGARVGRVTKDGLVVAHYQSKTTRKLMDAICDAQANLAEIAVAS